MLTINIKNEDIAYKVRVLKALAGKKTSSGVVELLLRFFEHHNKDIYNNINRINQIKNLVLMEENNETSE